MGARGARPALSLRVSSLGCSPGSRPASPASARTGEAGGLRGGQGGPIKPGAVADLIGVDPSAEWVVDPAHQASRSHNTPCAGRRLTGKVRHTVFGGEAVVVDGEAQR